jgi:hypothetical protein
MTTAALPAKKLSNLPILVAVLLGGAGAVMVAVALGLNQAAIAVLLISLGTALAFTNTEVAIIYTLIYVCVQGDVRRLAMLSGGGVSNDPLLLVGPAMVLLLVLKGKLDGQLAINTLLSKLIVALLVIMALQVLNPLQGGITVGLAGVMLYAVPLGWYWIGKSMSTPKMMSLIVFNVLVPLAALASLMGLYQTFVGFLPYQAHWIAVKINEQGYLSLMVGSQIRAFGFSCSMAEYDWLMSMASMALIATLLSFRLKRTTLLLLPLLLAIFLASGRGPVVMLIGSTAVMSGAMGRTPMARIFRFAIVPVILIPLLLSGLIHLRGVELSDRMQSLVQHQDEGFTRMQDSTAQGHAELVWSGITQSLRNPFGHGLGSTSVHANGQGLYSTEMDVSDMFLNLGLGGFVYVAVVIFGLRRAFIHFRTARTLTALAALGILVVTLGNWLTGMMYCIPPFVFFLIGSIDQRQLELESATEIPSVRQRAFRRSVSSRNVRVDKDAGAIQWH